MSTVFAGRNLSSKARMSECLQRMRQVWMPGLLGSRRVLRCHIQLLENMICLFRQYAHMVGSIYIFISTVYMYIFLDCK